MSQLNQLVKGGTAFLLLNQKNNKSRNALPRFFYLLLILFLPTQLGKHYWLVESSVLGIRIDYLSPTMYLTDILFLLFIGSYVFSARETIVLQLRNVLVRFWFFILLFLLFFLPSFIYALFFSERPVLIWYGLWKVCEMGVFVIMTAVMLRQREIKRATLFMFSLAMVFESALALLQFFSQSSLNGLLYFFGERSFTSETPGIARVDISGRLLLRPYGTFPHPNVLSGYLLFGILFLFSLYKDITSARLKQWISFVWMFSLVGIILTLSRFTIFFLVLFALFSLVKAKKYLLRKELLVIFVGILVLVLFFLPLLFHRFASLTLSSETVTQRIELSTSAFSMMRDNFFFGTGMLHFLVKLPSYSQVSSPVFFLQPVHNIFLLVFAETGLFTFIGFVWLFILLFKKAMGTEGVLRRILLTSLLLVLSIGMVDHYFLTIQQGQFLFAFVIGYILSVRQKNA